MSDTFDPSAYLKRRQGATQGLFESYKGNTASRRQQADELTQLAQKRSADSVRYTNFFLQNRLVKDLDDTLARQFREHPELKDQVYIGVITDEGFSAEVVPLDTAISSVEGVPIEEAEELLRSQPVGYFKRSDFTLKTPGGENFQSFKNGLQDYFERNRDIIEHLRNNPEGQVTAEDLYGTQT